MLMRYAFECISRYDRGMGKERVKAGGGTVGLKTSVKF